MLLDSAELLAGTGQRVRRHGWKSGRQVSMPHQDKQPPPLEDGEPQERLDLGNNSLLNLEASFYSNEEESKKPAGSGGARVTATLKVKSTWMEKLHQSDGP